MTSTNKTMEEKLLGITQAELNGVSVFSNKKRFSGTISDELREETAYWKNYGKELQDRVSTIYGQALIVFCFLCSENEAKKSIGNFSVGELSELITRAEKPEGYDFFRKIYTIVKSLEEEVILEELYYYFEQEFYGGCDVQTLTCLLVEMKRELKAEITQEKLPFQVDPLLLSDDFKYKEMVDNYVGAK